MNMRSYFEESNFRKMMFNVYVFSKGARSYKEIKEMRIDELIWENAAIKYAEELRKEIMGE